MDIITETPEESQTGFLAVSDEEYADAILNILSMSPETLDSLRARAVSSVQRFREKEFEKAWIQATESMIGSVVLHAT